MRKLPLIILLILLTACAGQVVSPSHVPATPKEGQIVNQPVTNNQQAPVKPSTKSTATQKSVSYQHQLTGTIEDSVVDLQKSCIDQLVNRIQSQHQKKALDEARVTEKVTVTGDLVEIECRITLME